MLISALRMVLFLSNILLPSGTFGRSCAQEQLRIIDSISVMYHNALVCYHGRVEEVCVIER